MGPEQIWLVSGGLGAVFIAAVLYMIGGTDMDGDGPGEGQKFWRRFVAAGILASAANVIALLNSVWVWQYLLMFLSLVIGFSKGYGKKDSTLDKVIGRTICALGILATCYIGLWATGFTFMGWVVMALAAITGLTSVVLGAINPFKNAPLEQGLICVVLCLYVPFWAYIR